MKDVDTSTIIIEPGRYVCAECGARFESVGDKKRHRKAAH